MSRYFSLTILFIILFAGCGVKQKRVALPIYMPSNVEAKNDKNYLILQALQSQYYDKNSSKAMRIYKNLYDKTNDLVYIKEAIRVSFLANNEKLRNIYLDIALKEFPKDNDILKFQANRYLQAKQYKKAKKIMLRLVKTDKSSENYMILGSINYLQKHYKSALRYYNLANKMVSSEDSLIKIATLLDENLNQTKKAIEYLESYIRMKRASRQVYFKLLQIYSSKLDLRGLISTYKLLYKDFGDDEYAKKVIELYLYAKDKKGAIKFLEKTKFQPNTLMDLYASDRKFSKAYKLAKKLYKEYNDIDYLGRMAIYQYEANQRHITPKILVSISKKFEQVLKKNQDPLYLNYYGYLLIDHNLNITKGMNYVKKALEKDPESIYYIDSLAWGFYRKGDCKKALGEIGKIIDKTDEKEIKDHYKAIIKCLKK